MKRFFIKTDNCYEVKKELKDCIVFAQHNLIKDPPFIKLDLLSCRNLLIYFTADLQKKVVPLFHYALNPNGILLLGPAETVGGFAELFQIVDPKWKIFRRQAGNKKAVIPDFPFQVPKQPLNLPKLEEAVLQHSTPPLSQTFNQILIDKFTPASVLVNEKGDILYNNGKTSKFLELPKGITVANNVFKLARQELRYALGAGIEQALSKEGVIVTENIRVKDGNIIRKVRLQSTAIHQPDSQPYVLIVFEDQEMEPSSNGIVNHNEVSGGGDGKSDIQTELVYTQQMLFKTVDEMEYSVEKLRLSNEELQSTNEELQSTNEESLTTKEEMQSLNEELMTVNMQFQSKAEQLTRVNNDLKNILDATELCTIFLDNDLHIVRFTPQARTLFNLISSDIGRPIRHIVSSFEKPLDEEDIREVIDKLLVKVFDVRTRDNHWYRLLIMPYRTLDNYISGAVLTLTLITDYKRMESRLSVLQDYAETLLNALPQAVAQLDKDLRVESANDQFFSLFDVEKNKLVGLKADEFIEKRWKTKTVGRMLLKCLAEPNPNTTTLTFQKDRKTYLINIRTFLEDTNTTPLIVIMINEKTSPLAQ